MPPPEEMQATMIANLASKTGRTLDEWVEVALGSGLEKHGQIVGMLKAEHGVSHGYANLIAHAARGSSSVSAAAGSVAPPADQPDLVDAQYEGKEDLRPLYEQITAAVEAFGGDVELAPKKSYVSLRRSKQFGLVQPSTKTRLDIGLKLRDAAASERLEASGSWNAMVTHRVRVTRAEDVDDELLSWLRRAYEEA
jgi:predicted transport protein